MSEKKEKPKNKNVMQELMKFTRKVNTLGKAIDFVTEELVQEIFQDDVLTIYRHASENVDNFIRKMGI